MSATLLKQPELLTSVELEVAMDEVFMAEMESPSQRYSLWRELFAEYQRRLEAAKAVACGVQVEAV